MPVWTTTWNENTMAVGIEKCPSTATTDVVQMSIPQGQIIQKGIDKEYDMHLEALYNQYHDFLDIMMRMAVNTNQLNESLVKLSCLAAIEAAPLHFNLFQKFWVGINNNKSTNKCTELLVSNPNLIEYVDIMSRDERISLNDPAIRSFVEIYYPKITSGLAISRLIYSISYKLQSKEDSDESAVKSNERKLAEQREKGKCYLKIIESYMEAILDLIQRIPINRNHRHRNR